MIIYIYSKCSTCQKALRFLEKKHVKVTKKEITETPPSLSELKMMLDHQKGNLKKLFNTSGTLYRDLRLKDKLEYLPIKDGLQLLTQNGMLVKRPFLLGEGVGLSGFSEVEWLNHFKT